MPDDVGKTLRTQRFLSYALGLGVLTVLAIVALLTRVDGALAAAVTAPIVTLASAAVIAGNWHDKNVRDSIADPSGPMPKVEVTDNAEVVVEKQS